MLKPLLLLWCAATIVSATAGEQKNDSIPLEPTKSESIDQKISATTLSIDTNAHSTNDTTNDPKVPPVIISTTNSPKTEPTKPTPTKSTTTSTTTTTTTTTTPPPNTTTHSPTTTTPVPTTPLPPPSTAKWIVSENKTLCIIVQVAAQLNVSFTDKNNRTIQKALDIPVNGTITGKCGVNEQNLTFSWNVTNKNITNKNVTNSNFTLHFVKNDTDKHYSLHHLEIFLAEIPMESNKSLNLVHMVPQFTTGLSNSYRCIKEQTLNLTRGDNKNVTVAHLKVSDLQFQAFRSDNSTVFGIAQDCSFNTPDIVPITVGCALAGLVVVVLIAYLVGRRRSQARGYLSM